MLTGVLMCVFHFYFKEIYIMDIITFVLENASANTWAEFFLGCMAVAGCCYLIYKEKQIAQWERKVWKYTKAFFKALVYTIIEKLEKRNVKTHSRTSK